MSDPKKEERDVLFGQFGRPYPTFEEATIAMGRKGLNPNEWEVLPESGGFVIARITEDLAAGQVETDSQPPSEGIPEAKTPDEKYWVVIFQGKPLATDQDDIALGVNNETVLVPRGQETILPDRFLEAARNATHSIVKPKRMGNDMRLVPETVSRCPFHVLREATKKDFEELRQKGNKLSHAISEQWGLDGLPPHLADMLTTHQLRESK